MTKPYLLKIIRLLAQIILTESLIMYESTNEKILKSLDQVDIFNWYSKYITYNLSNNYIPSHGKYKIGQTEHAGKQLFGSWTSKEEYMELFGNAEAVVKFPVTPSNNQNVVIYTHCDPEGIVRDYVVHSIKALMILGYDVLFHTSAKSLSNVSMPFKLFTHEFPDSVSMPDRHAIMFCRCFLATKFMKYKHILYINSMHVLPVHGMEMMDKSLNSARKQSDFWMLYDTRGIVYNNTCIEFTKKCVPSMKHFVANLLNAPSLHNISQSLEIEMPYHLIKQGFKFYGINEYPNLTNFQAILRSQQCFAITLGQVKRHLSQKGSIIRNPVLRFLLRYLNLDDYNMVSLGNQ